MTSPETGERRPIPVITTTQHTDDEPGTGAVHDAFAWNQTHTDLDVRVYVPRSVTKSKQLHVELTKNRVKISRKEPDATSDHLVILEGTFRRPVNSAESMWILVPGEYVQMTLEKAAEGWWDSLVEGEAGTTIDVSKMDAEVSFNDLANAEQQQIRRMVYDEKMRAAGRPTSEEEEVDAILRQAWDADGSPCKSQSVPASSASSSSSKRSL